MIFTFHQMSFGWWNQEKQEGRDTWHVLEIKELQTVENLADGDHMEDVGLYGRITLHSIFRFIQIIHMNPGQQSGKKVNHWRA